MSSEEASEPDVAITFTPEFKREYKRLAKKYASLENDLKALINQLKEEPNSGTSLGNSTFKIRLAIASKNKGKSGGARVITYYITQQNELYLLYIYDKSEQANIPDNAIKEIIANLAD